MPCPKSQELDSDFSSEVPPPTQRKRFVLSTMIDFLQDWNRTKISIIVFCIRIIRPKFGRLVDLLHAVTKMND